MDQAVSCPSEEDVIQKWTEFKIKFNKKYADEKEEKTRKELFIKNLQKIEEHNEKFKQGVFTFEMGVNQFSDLTSEEMKKYTCGVIRPSKN